jgi:hypothetical protein
MWRVVGICKETLRAVEVAVASNAAELSMILRQERGNYFRIRYEKVL